jgi:transposase
VYANDLRRAVVTAYEKNEYSQHRIAALFGVSPRTVQNWIRRKRETGSPDVTPYAGRVTVKLDERIQKRLRQRDEPIAVFK